MYRTTVLLPEELKKKVEYRARLSDVSLGEFVRKSLEQALSNKGLNSLRNDPFIMDKNIYSKDIGSDVSKRHDDYIYGKRK